MIVRRKTNNRTKKYLQCYPFSVLGCRSYDWPRGLTPIGLLRETHNDHTNSSLSLSLSRSLSLSFSLSLSLSLTHTQSFTLPLSCSFTKLGRIRDFEIQFVPRIRIQTKFGSQTQIRFFFKFGQNLVKLGPNMITFAQNSVEFGQNLIIIWSKFNLKSEFRSNFNEFGPNFAQISPNFTSF